MTQTNFFNSLNSSNRAIITSAQKKGLPFIDFDDLQNQLVPGKLATTIDSPFKLPSQSRLSLSSLEPIQKEGPTPKKKTVAFSEENEILGPSRSGSSTGLDTEPEKPKRTIKVQKGILVKRKRYNDAGANQQYDIKATDGMKNPSQEDTGAGNRELLESQKTEIDEMTSPFILMSGDALRNNLAKRNFPGLETVKQGSATENTEVTQEDPYLKTESLAQSFRKKFELPREDLISSRKVLATLFSPKLAKPELCSPMFKVPSNKEIFPLLQINSPNESVINKDPKSNVFVNNASKIMFNVSDNYNKPFQPRGSSPRVFGKGVYALFNRRQPMELDKFESPAPSRKPSEERLPVLESPYTNFQKRHVKSNSAFQDSRGNFAFSTGNTIMKSESQIFPKKPSIKPFNPMVPRLDLFADFPRGMPSSNQNTPRKYLNPNHGLLSSRTVSNNL